MENNEMQEVRTKRKYVKSGKPRKPREHKPGWQSRRGVPLNVRVDKDIMEWVDERKDIDGVSRNEILRRIMKLGIYHYGETI